MLECDALVVGGGFGGAYAARELERQLGHRAERVVLVTPENFLLFSPLLAEAASGTIEPRHAVVPLRLMCPHAELVLGRAGEHDLKARRVQVQTESELLWLGYEHLVVAVGALVVAAWPLPPARYFTVCGAIIAIGLILALNGTA